MVVICMVCNKTFCKQYSLNRYNRKIHHLAPKHVVYDQSEYMYKCVKKDCGSSFRWNIGLRAHTEKHNNRFCIQKMELSSQQEFKAWKESMEKYRKTRYGHKSELQHFRLLQQDKAMVASKLILGVPASRYAI
ncbi:hypothetical protein HUJ04_011320 [Dendroctonus ponderosae]|nr:hypothetical protein HUJ04_011320 [Dendroctonus ponderosae]